MHAYSMVSVPLYDTLGPDAVEYISNHAELAAIACSAQVICVHCFFHSYGNLDLETHPDTTNETDGGTPEF